MGRLGSESVSRRGEEETRTRHKTTETRCVVASVRAQEHGWVMELYNTHSIGQTVLKFENSKNIDRIELLRSFYDEFQEEFPGLGKQEVISSFKASW